MSGQIVFALILLVTLGVFAYTVYRLARFFSFTKAGFPVKHINKRIGLMVKVAFGQTKIFRLPLVGLAHALVFWGFCLILFGSIEMVIDGLAGTDKVLSTLGGFYRFMMASGDIFAYIVAAAILIFIVRRLFVHIRRFEGIEMKKTSHIDALVALSLILILMLSLIGMNTGYYGYKTLTGQASHGAYPISSILAGLLTNRSPDALYTLYDVCWWTHILTIFVFANILPYSKHFHVFLSVPNVFLSRLEPLGKLINMRNVTREVKLMMNPDTAFAPEPAEVPVERFGIRDAEDVVWKTYFDSLSCTQCGRCTSVCPANITGKRLSPRKVMMDLRARMREKGPLMIKNGREYNDNKSLLRDYITEEELWACTTCNACARECPVNINHPSLIVDMRRYLVMEEGSAPGELKSVFSNIENNGAPWQYSADDRLLWTRDLGFNVPVMSDLFSRGEKPEYLYWVGCAGAFDDRYKKVARAFAAILSHLNISYAVLGREETCTGDPARRAGNEMLFQMQALQVIELLNSYGIKKILTTCPHCYNVFRNEYPDLGGGYEVINYVQFLEHHAKEGRLKLTPEALNETGITYHDPCYLGRANEIYDEPRTLLKRVTGKFVEMDRNRSFALCCGAGGAQMFKEAEKGNKEVFIERTEDALATDTTVIATACPFCMTMLTDGLKYKNKEESIKNLDIAEIVAQSLDI
jgi:Fe-S oxidoreductase/nitrate reductase gamma subunit